MLIALAILGLVLIMTSAVTQYYSLAVVGLLMQVVAATLITLE